jgi:ATPase components of ABC transporters with duplicated ATPase domains
MIPYVDVQNLSKSFGALRLFSNISFSISEGQKVGLIAKNGTGKSTLLSVLAGKEGYEQGDIVFRRDLTVGYLEQSPQFDPEESVLDACIRSPKLGDNRGMNKVSSDPQPPNLGGMEIVLKAKQVLTQLKISNLEQPMGQLSGGQQKRVALANVLLMEPDLLILDEPTNHLDLEMIEWLEGYLSRGNRTLLMVTHDRFFLDRVCSVIMELDDQTIYTYRGNYSYYLEKRQERIDNRRAEIARANNLYRTELEWMRRMPQARGHKARYREEAFYELEKVAKQRLEERQLRLKANNVYIGTKIFECQYISKMFRGERREVRGEKNNDVVILKDFYYNFSRFEKMGIVGNNGTGKSTFIKMLLGQVPVDEGRIVIGETVRFGYFSQEGLQFREDQKVIDVITAIADYVDLGSGKKLSASQLLQYFLFTPEQQYNYVYKLSGGERRKLYLCTVLMKNPNFLVLDEPTNDLDIVTLQILEEYLQDFPGCVIVVSHDRYFMDKVVDHLLVFKGQGVVKDFPGNYTQYREWERSLPPESGGDRGLKKGKKENCSTPQPPNLGGNNAHRRRMSYKEKREFEQLAQEIAALEEEQHQLEEALCSGKLSVEELTEKSKRLPLLKEELDEKSMRWLELSEIDN